MNPGTLETPRYASLRKGGKVLGRLALWVQLGFLIMGMGLFLDQARDLLSDAQFTWGERRVMGVIALVTLGGCGLAGWILGQLFRIFAQLLDVLADGAEAAWRAGDLIEPHLVPTPGAHCPGFGRKGWLCRTASRDFDVCRECQCQGDPDRDGRG